MRRGALLSLLLRPLTIAFAAVFLPVAVIALSWVASKSTAAVVGVSSLTCFVLGNFVGGGIKEAARCAFSWTLPRFRHELPWEFVVCGAAWSTVVGLLLMVSTTGAAHSSLMASVTGFAAYSLAGALLLGPEASVLLPAAFLALVAARPSVPGTLLREPVVAAALAAVVSGLALWYAFAGRTFRWSALTGPGQDGRFVWHEWPTIPWWPRFSHRRTGPRLHGSSRARYVGASVRGGVASSYRVTKPTWWLAGLALGVLCVLAAVGWNGFSSVRRSPLPSLWTMLTVATWVCASWSHRSAWRTTLPWSRRHHLAVTYVRDLGDLLAFLLVVGTAIVVAGAVGHTEGLSAAGRGVAVVLVFFPAFQWLTGPPTGGQWSNQGVMAVLGLVGFVVFMVVLNLVVNGLPTLVSSGVAQAFLLGLLVVGAQVLNWRRLKGYFANRDLVGGEP